MAGEEQVEAAVSAAVSDNVEVPSGFALGADMAQEEEGRRSSAASITSKSSSSSGKVWIHNVGWRVLPSDAQRDQGSYWAWSSADRWFRFHTNEDLFASSEGSWMQIRGPGLDSAARAFDKFEKDGDVPEWDGKSHRSYYFRKIDIWKSTTGCPPEKQALKLLQKLTGEAFEKLEHIDPESLRREDGIELFKKAIVDVYEPIEDYRVGKIMDDFLYGFERKKGQEILDYN